MQTFTDETAPYQIPFEAYGMGMRICTNTHELLERIEPMLPPGSRRRPHSASQYRIGILAEDDDMYSLYRDDGHCVHDAPGKEYALVMLEGAIRSRVALDAPDYIFVHAGVVADRERAIVLPGGSFTGKSTLVRALVEAGALYYSDEFAVLDKDGRVHPFPKPIEIRPHEAPPVEYRVEELGGVAGVEPLPVGMVIAARYRPGAEWQPHELSGGARALALMEHAVPAQSRPEQTMRFIVKAINGAVSLKGTRGDADELAPRLLETLHALA